MGWASMLLCLTCWWRETEGDNTSGVSCRWLLVGMGGGMSAVIVFLAFWLKATLKEKDADKDARYEDMKERYDKLDQKKKHLSDS